MKEMPITSIIKYLGSITELKSERVHSKNKFGDENRKFMGILRRFLIDLILAAMDLQKHIALEAKLLKLTGFYPQKQTTMMQNFRAVLVIFVAISSDILFYLNLFSENQEILTFTTSVLYLVGTFFVSWKYLAFLKTRRNILKLEEILTSPILCEFSEMNENIFEEIINSKFFPMCKGFGIAFAIVVQYLIIKCGIVRKLFLPMKVFGSLEDNVNLSCYVVLQTAFGILIPWHYVLIDLLCYKMMSIATATLHILKYNLESIPYEKRHTDVLLFTLKKNIILHKEIVRFTTLIENTFSYVTLTIILSGVLVNCICGIIILKMSLTLAEGSTFFLFFACTMNQIAIYCWFGEQIMSKSMKISNSSYMSKWYSADMKIRNYLFIFMERVKKPIILRAGHFFPLNVQTLASILHKSYSTFTVLQQFYKDK